MVKKRDACPVTLSRHFDNIKDPVEALKEFHEGWPDNLPIGGDDFDMKVMRGVFNKGVFKGKNGKTWNATNSTVDVDKELDQKWQKEPK